MHVSIHEEVVALLAAIAYCRGKERLSMATTAFQVSSSPAMPEKSSSFHETLSRWEALKPRGNEPGAHRLSGTFPADYASLLRSYQSDHSLAVAASLAQLVKSNIDKYKGEKIAQELVYDVFVASLEDEVDTISMEDAQMDILACLSKLLKSKTHASSILAPFVEEVDEEGKEVQAPNYIRMELFSVLEQRVSGFEHEECQSPLSQQLCICLADSLFAAHALEGTQKHAGWMQHDVDPSVVQRYIAGCLLTKTSTTQIRQPALQLLLALLRRHPESAVTLAMFMLDEAVVIPRKSGQGEDEVDVTNFTGRNTFLDILHSGMYTAECRLATDCLKEVLDHAPFSLWLQTASSNDGYKSRASARPTSFQQHIASGVSTLLQIMHYCLLRRKSEAFHEQLSGLCRSLLLKLPFEDSDELTRAAADMVGTMASIVVDRPRVAAFRHELRDILIDSLGGKPTPSGDLTRLRRPMKTWLVTDGGRKFVVKLLDNTKLAFELQDLLCAIVCAVPETILDDGYMYKHLRRFIRESLKDWIDPDIMVCAARVVEALLRGRFQAVDEQSWSSSPSCGFIRFILNLLRQVNATWPEFSTPMCEAYGALLPMDWDEIVQHHGGCHQDIVRLLNIAGDKTAAHDLRAVAMKAAGDVSTHYFSVDRFVSNADFGADASAVANTMASALTDALQSLTGNKLRGMVLFAAGNLAESIKHQATPVVFEKETIGKLAIQTQFALGDSDDKSVSNAIRAVGHFCCVLFEDPMNDNVVENVTKCDFLDAVLGSLCQRIYAALDAALMPNNSYTWKQRTAIKKHAWGACNAMIAIFDVGLEDSIDGIVEPLRDATDLLCSCLTHCDKVHSKIGQGAATAFRSLLLNISPKSADKVISVPNLLLVCIDLTSKTELDPKVHSDVDLIFDELLKSLTLSQAVAVLRSDPGSARLHKLCDWMEERSVDTAAFNLWAKAIQNAPGNASLEIEQRFASYLALNLLETSAESDDDDRVNDAGVAGTAVFDAFDPTKLDLPTFDELDTAINVDLAATIGNADLDDIDAGDVDLAALCLQDLSACGEAASDDDEI